MGGNSREQGGSLVSPQGVYRILKRHNQRMVCICTNSKREPTKSKRGTVVVLLPSQTIRLGLLRWTEPTACSFQVWCHLSDNAAEILAGFKQSED